MHLNRTFLSVALLGVLGVCSMHCYASDSSIEPGTDADGQPEAQRAIGERGGSSRGSGGSGGAAAPSPRRPSSIESQPVDAGNPEDRDAGVVGGDSSVGACSSHDEKECDRFLPYACEAGSHLDVVAGEPCPVCVPDDGEAPSCEEGRARYPEFLEDLERQSCVGYCESDADCATWKLSNACKSGAQVALHGGVDEELIQAAAAFAEDNCAACGAQPSEVVRSELDATCVNHRCELHFAED